MHTLAKTRPLWALLVDLVDVHRSNKKAVESRAQGSKEFGKCDHHYTSRLQLVVFPKFFMDKEQHYHGVIR